MRQRVLYPCAVLTRHIAGSADSAVPSAVQASCRRGGVGPCSTSRCGRQRILNDRDVDPAAGHLGRYLPRMRFAGRVDGVGALAGHAAWRCEVRVTDAGLERGCLSPTMAGDGES